MCYICVRGYSELFHQDFILVGTKYEFYITSGLWGSSHIYQPWTTMNTEALLYLNIVGICASEMLVSTCKTVEGNQQQHTDRLSHFIAYSCKIRFYIGMWLVSTISKSFLRWRYFNIWLCNIKEQYVSAVGQLILIFLDNNNLPKCISRTLFTPQETVNT
jgi:hypothetical protein